MPNTNGRWRRQGCHHRRSRTRAGSRSATRRSRARTRAVWIWPSLERVSQDVVYTVRSLRRDPGFTLVALVALGGAIGLNASLPRSDQTTCAGRRADDHRDCRDHCASATRDANRSHCRVAVRIASVLARPNVTLFRRIEYLLLQRRNDNDSHRKLSSTAR